MKALSVHREERYATANEFSGDLERFTLRRFRAVSGRDVGRVVADAFIEDRKRIRDVIETHLSGPPLADSSLPELALSIDTGKSSTESDVLRSQIHLLRRALADAGYDGLETVHGVGYRLRPEGASA